MASTPSSSPVQSRLRGRLVLGAVLFLVLACIVTAVLGLLWMRGIGIGSWGPFLPPQAEAARHAARDVVGDLGGVPVTIPRHFANFVTYEGDPGIGKRREGPQPERTHASKLIGFGFPVRFPDMAGLSSPELRADKQKQSIYNTMWINVGVTTGKNFPGTGFLDRQVSYINKPGEQFRYEILPQLQDGLTVYVPVGTDPRTGQPYRDHPNAEDIFLHRDKDGHVDTHIRCSNRPHKAAPCVQSFSLEPHMKAEMYVKYRRDLLPEWNRIQVAVGKLVYGFAISTQGSEVETR